MRESRVGRRGELELAHATRTAAVPAVMRVGVCIGLELKSTERARAQRAQDLLGVAFVRAAARRFVRIFRGIGAGARDAFSRDNR